MACVINGRSYTSLPEVSAAIAALDRRFAGKPYDAAALAEWRELNEFADELEQDIRRDRVRELARRGGGRRASLRAPHR